jgi:hypothetical protein
MGASGWVVRFYMELVFLLIFLIFIALNVVIGLASSRAKKRRAIERAQRADGNDGPPSEIDERRYGEPKPIKTGDEPSGYFLEPQTAESLVSSLGEAVREQERVRSENLARAEEDSVDRSMVQEEVPDIADERAPLPGRTAETAEIREGVSAPVEPPLAPERSISPEQPTPSQSQSRSRLGALEGKLLSEDAGRGVLVNGAAKDRTDYRLNRAWKYVEGLPGLKRAIVLSEILGKPRSHSEGSHTH